MIFAVGALTALLAAILYLHDRERKEWRDERQNLLERIRDPAVKPVLERGPEKDPLPLDAPELALVGEIRWEDEGA